MSFRPAPRMTAPTSAWGDADVGVVTRPVWHYLELFKLLHNRCCGPARCAAAPGSPPPSARDRRSRACSWARRVPYGTSKDRDTLPGILTQEHMPFHHFRIRLNARNRRCAACRIAPATQHPAPPHDPGTALPGCKVTGHGAPASLGCWHDAVSLQRPPCSSAADIRPPRVCSAPHAVCCAACTVASAGARTSCLRSFGFAALA